MTTNRKLEAPHYKSNGHVTNESREPRKLKVVTPVGEVKFR